MLRWRRAATQDLRTNSSGIPSRTAGLQACKRFLLYAHTCVEWVACAMEPGCARRNARCICAQVLSSGPSPSKHSFLGVLLHCRCVTFALEPGVASAHPRCVAACLE